MRQEQRKKKTLRTAHRPRAHVRSSTSPTAPITRTSAARRPVDGNGDRRLRRRHADPADSNRAHGEECEDVMRLILANVRGSDERRADFEAQIGSLKTGATRLLEIVSGAARKKRASTRHT